MDFMQRGNHSSKPAAQQSAVSAAPAPAAGAPHRRAKHVRWAAICSTLLLFSIAVLIIALAMSFVFVPGRNEDKFVDSKKFQAVFLSGGQVYFGNVTNLNHRYVRMVNIYYLRVNQQVQPGQQTGSNDVSLVKLGCELHGPVDEMLMNRDQVTFWENLKTDGQVAKAVAEFVKQNPNGQKCETNTQTTSPAPTPAPTPAPAKKQ
jgi:hypothetical protein